MGVRSGDDTTTCTSSRNARRVIVPLHPRRNVYLTCFGKRNCDGNFATRVTRVLGVFLRKGGVELRISASRVYSTYPGGLNKRYRTKSGITRCSGTILRGYKLGTKRALRFDRFAGGIRRGVLTVSGHGRVYKGYR